MSAYINPVLLEWAATMRGLSDDERACLIDGMRTNDRLSTIGKSFFKYDYSCRRPGYSGLVDKGVIIPRFMWSDINIPDDVWCKACRVNGRTQGYVYLLKQDTRSIYKIGRSINPATRIRQLGVVLPFPIDVFHLIQTNDCIRLERELHELYADHRLNGEWFEIDEDDLTKCYPSFVYNEEANYL